MGRYCKLSSRIAFPSSQIEAVRLGKHPGCNSDPAGHPLSGLYGSFDAYAGGYSGGRISHENTSLRNAFFNPATVNSNPINSGYAYGPVNSGNTLTGLGKVAKSVGKSAVSTFNPLATTVVNTAAGIAASTIATVLPPAKGSANQEQSFFDVVNPFGLYHSGSSGISKHAELDRQIAKIQQDNVSKLGGYEYIEARHVQVTRARRTSI